MPGTSTGQRRPLRAVRFTALRTTWVLTLLAAAASMIGGQYYYWRSNVAPIPAFAEFGLIYAQAEPPTLASLDSAERGRVPKGALAAVNGAAVGKEANARTVAALLQQSGDSVRLRFHPESGEPVEVTLRRDPAIAERVYSSTLLTRWSSKIVQEAADFLGGLVMLVAALLLFVRRPTDRVAVLLSFSFLLALLTYGWPLLHAVGQGRLSDWIDGASWGLLAIVLLIFPTGTFHPKWARWAVPLLVTMVIVWILEWHTGRFMFLEALGLGIGMAALVLRYRSTAAETERQQLKWAMWGFVFGTLVIGAGYLGEAVVQAAYEGVRAEIWGETIRITFRAAGWALFAAGLLISMLRYRLYDVGAVASRSTVYVALSVLFIPCWALAQNVLEDLLLLPFGEAGGIATLGVSGAIAAALVSPARKRATDWAQQRFQSGLLQLRDSLPERIGDLRETATIQELLEEALLRIASGVHAGSGAISLKRNGTWEVAATFGTDAADVERWHAGWLHTAPATLDCDRADRQFPLRIALAPYAHEPASVTGWILLGPRKDGSFYPKPERDVLRGVAAPLARAVEIIRLRDQRNLALRHEVVSLRERLRALEDALAAAHLTAIRPAG
jgi:hypothetical protein